MSSNIITLPPGVDADQYLKAEELATKLRIVAAVVMALFLWDYLVLFNREVKLYKISDKTTLKTPAFWLFIILRYAPFLAAPSAIAFSSFNVSNCQSVANVSFAGVLLMQFASSGVFLLRILALMQQPFKDIFSREVTLKKALSFIAVVLFIANTACWIAILPGYGFVTGPPTRYGSNCLDPTTYSWSALPFGTAFVYDSYVVFLTVCWYLKVRKAGMDLSGIVSLILRDGALYFLFASVCNLMALVINLLPASESYYRSFATPLVSFAVTATSQRVFLNLKLIVTNSEARNNLRISGYGGNNKTSFRVHRERFSRSSAPAADDHTHEEKTQVNEIDHVSTSIARMEEGTLDDKSSNSLKQIPSQSDSLSSSLPSNLERPADARLYLPDTLQR